MENPITPTEYEPEFTESELEVMKVFGVKTGLTMRELKEAARILKRMGIVEVEESDHVVDTQVIGVAYFNTIEPIKVENRDRIPVPNKYKRNRFQR